MMESDSAYIERDILGVVCGSIGLVWRILRAGLILRTLKKLIVRTPGT